MKHTEAEGRALNPGDRVRLTGAFLRSTGQQRGREGMSVWTVRAVEGSFIVTDQKHDPRYMVMTWPEFAEGSADYESLVYRRFHAGNLERAKS